MNHVDFSSWPREQEAQFAVFEHRASESSKKALLAGIVSGAILLVLAVGVYAGVSPEHKDMTKGMNMENLSNRPVEK